MLKQQNKLETRDRRGCGWRCRICWLTGSSRSGRSLTHPWRNIRRSWGSARARCKNTRPGPESYPSHGADNSGPPSREPGPAAGDVQRRRDGGCGPDVPDPGVVHGAFGGEPQGAGGAVPGTEPFPERRAGRGSRAPKRAEGRAMTSG